MKLREKIVWVLVILNAGATVYAIRVARHFQSENLESSEMVYQCAVQLEACGDRCTSEREQYIIKANEIFECELRICEVNGWKPPGNWEEHLKAYGEHKDDDQG